MIRKLLIILLLLILQKGMLFCQSFEIIPPTKIQNFNDILDVNFESDSLVGTSCYLELKISINGTQEMLGVTNSINIDEYRVGDFHFVSKKTENEKLTKIISNNGELQHGEYLIEYLIIDFASQKQLNSIVVEYSIEHKNGKPICVKQIILPPSIVGNNKTPQVNDSLKNALKKKVTKLSLSGTVSSKYSFGLQQFNPTQSPPKGFLIYNGNAIVGLGLLPINVSFQYTDFKDYYGIPKYFKVSLDIPKFKQNLITEKLKGQAAIEDSIKRYTRSQQIIGQQSLYLKSLIDTSEINQKRKLLENDEFIKQKLDSELILKSIEYSAIDTSGISDSLKYIYKLRKSELDSLQTIQNKLTEKILLGRKYQNDFDSLKNTSNKYTKDYNDITSKIDSLKRIKLQDNPSVLSADYLKSVLNIKTTKLNGIFDFLMHIQKFEIGLCNPNYNLLLVNGIPLKGFNIEYEKKSWRFAVAYGKTIVNPLLNLQRYQYNPLLIQRNAFNYFDFNNDTSSRKLLAAQIGKGEKNGTHFFVGIIEGLDNHEKDSNVLNHVINLDLQWKVNENNLLQFIMSKGSSIHPIERYDALGAVYRQQSNDGICFNYSSRLSGIGTRLKANVRLLQTHFENYALVFVSGDNLRYNLSATQTINKLLEISINFNSFEDNLLWLYTTRNAIKILGSTLKYTLSKKITITNNLNKASVLKTSRIESFQGNNQYINNTLIQLVLDNSTFILSNNYYNLKLDSLTRNNVKLEQCTFTQTYNSKSLSIQNQCTYFHYNSNDTLKESLIFQSGVSQNIKSINYNASILFSGSKNNNIVQLDYGFIVGLKIKIYKGLSSEVFAQKRIQGNYLIGINEDLLRKYPYSFTLKLAYSF